jgi:hypothetical protein
MIVPDKLGALAAASALFEAAATPYALIGVVAVGIRTGVPRATLDVNLRPRRRTTPRSYSLRMRMQLRR